MRLTEREPAYGHEKMPRKPVAREDADEGWSEASKRRQLLGRPVLDRDDNELGRVEAVYADEESGSPAWALVTSGSVGGPGRFVPMADAIIEEHRVRVGYGEAWVSAAPSVDLDEGLSARQEDQLLGHYGLSRPGPRSLTRVSTPADSSPAPAARLDAGEIAADRPTPPVVERPARVEERGATVTRRVASEARLEKREPLAARVRVPGPRRVVRTSPRPASPQRVSKGFNPRAAFLGWLSAIGLLALLGTMLGGFLGSAASSAGGADGGSALRVGALLLSVFTAYFVGGYVAGGVARSSGARQGLGVWAVALIVTVALALLSAVADTPLDLLAAVAFPRLVLGDESAGAAIALTTLLGSLVCAVVGGQFGAHLRGEARRALTSVPGGRAVSRGTAARGRSTPTWSRLRRTELLAFPAVVAGVLVATLVIDAGDGGSLGALQGWTLAAALAIGYVLSRGFAKSGIRAHRGSPGRSRERTARRAGRGRS